MHDNDTRLAAMSAEIAESLSADSIRELSLDEIALVAGGAEIAAF